MLCFNKYKSNLRTLRKKPWRHKMFLIILRSSLTSQNKKVTLGDTTAWGRVIALFFFIPLSLPPKNLTFPRTNESKLIHYTLGGSMWPPEVNTQRNKSSPRCTKSSGNTHSWMTHFNWHEVVLCVSIANIQTIIHWMLSVIFWTKLKLYYCKIYLPIFMHFA